MNNNNKINPLEVQWSQVHESRTSKCNYVQETTWSILYFVSFYGCNFWCFCLLKFSWNRLWSSSMMTISTRETRVIFTDGYYWFFTCSNHPRFCSLIDLIIIIFLSDLHCVVMIISFFESSAVLVHDTKYTSACCKFHLIAFL